MSNTRPIILKILVWTEIILSIRVLLFVVPVMINLAAADKPLSSLGDWFVVMMGGSAFFFVIASVATLIGSRVWRTLHFVAILTTCICSGAFFGMAVTNHAPLTGWYFAPAVFALVVLALVFPQGISPFQSDRPLRTCVLVIDDDPVFLRTLQKVLLNNGYSVLTAATGEQGLQVAKLQAPDLILLDVILPGIKGREVCSILKESDQTKNIPVIFLTAKNSPDDVDAEMAAGGTSHLTKPVNTKLLLIEIKNALQPAKA